MIEARPGPMAIRADRLIDGTGSPVRRDVTVVIADGEIVSVFEAGGAAPSELPVARFAGATLIPGLVDSHLHLAFSEVDVPLDTEAALAVARRHAGELLLGGVTTARDLGSVAGAGAAIRDEVAAGQAIGPRLLSAIQPITRAGGHCHWMGRLAGDVPGIRAAVGRLTDEGADVIKIMVTGGMSTPGSRPGTPQYAVDEVRAATEAAHARGLRIAGHALGTQGVRVALAAGIDTLEHGWTVTGLGQGFEPSVVAEVAASSVIGSVTSHEKLRDLLPGETTAAGDLDEIRRRLVPHRALAAAGVPMVVHSDCGPYRTRFDRFGLSIRVYLEGMGVSVEEAIRAATAMPAAALGLGDRVGTIRPGLAADLVIIDGDPTLDPDAFTRVRHVILAGRMVVQDGAHTAPTTEVPWLRAGAVSERRPAADPHRSP